MPEVKGPNGIPINLPNSINGKKLRESFNIPPNQKLSIKDAGGQEKVVNDTDVIPITPDTEFESFTSFERGS